MPIGGEPIRLKLDHSHSMMNISRRHFLQSAAACTVSLPLSGFPAIAAEGELTFLVIGDWGKPDHVDDARAVATQMGKTAERIQARFVLSTGDNFYDRGVSDVDDPLWRTAYEDVYTAPSLMCPWYVVLGNHDHRGSVGAQILYSLKSRRWNLPARYYRRGETLADGSPAEFFFLDTDPIASLSWADRWLWRDKAVQEQLDWLEQGLASSKSAWKIVVGHHPVYSGGQHGNTPSMMECVKPLLDRYGVRAYINGHDHDVQHVVVDDVHYLTCGSGSDVRPTTRMAGTLYAGSALGFMSARISPREMDFTFIGEAGEALYAAKITD